VAAEAFEVLPPHAAQAESGYSGFLNLPAHRPPRSGVSRFPRRLDRIPWGSGLCLGFNLDPDTRHYPDRDTKKRLNNSS